MFTDLRESRARNLVVSDISTVIAQVAPSGSEPSFDRVRNNLLDLARKKMSQDGYFKTFQKDMVAFEQRMMDASPVQVQRTYSQLVRLINQQSSVMDDQNKTLLVEQILHRAAQPGQGINQGSNNDCVVAVFESLCFSKSPAETTKVLAEIALTGAYQTADGRNIALRTGISRPLENSLAIAKRDFVDQLFQVSAINTLSDLDNQSTNPPGQIRYEVQRNGDNYEERVYDDSKNPPTVAPFAGIIFTPSLAAELYYKMTGNFSQELMLENDATKSVNDLRTDLTNANRVGGLPMLAAINLSSGLYEKELAAFERSPIANRISKTGFDIVFERRGEHAIAIENYDVKTDTVSYLDPGLGILVKTSAENLAEGMGLKSLGSRRPPAEVSIMLP